MQLSRFKNLPPRTTQRLKVLMQSLVAVMVFSEIVFLSPETVDSPEVGIDNRIDRESLLNDVRKDGPRRAPGIPEGRIPDYTIEGFSYLSVEGTQKIWKLNSNRAFLYNSAGIVHAREVSALLYDDANHVTRVTGREGKFTGHRSDLEVFGDVKAIFPDGFVMESQYLRFYVKGRDVRVPDTERVRGVGRLSPRETLSFEGFGFHFPLSGSEIRLNRNTITKVEDVQNGLTVIRSDSVQFVRSTKTMVFGMSPTRPPAEAYVRMAQPDLAVESRRLTFNLGKWNSIEYGSAREDVTIQELRKGASLKSATCGRADFNAKKNVLVLTELPQVYQGSDTITGEKITLYRDKDLVEVDYSNAFSGGKKKPRSQRRGQNPGGPLK